MTTGKIDKVGFPSINGAQCGYKLRLWTETPLHDHQSVTAHYRKGRRVAQLRPGSSSADWALCLTLTQTDDLGWRRQGHWTCSHCHRFVTGQHTSVAVLGRGTRPVLFSVRSGSSSRTPMCSHNGPNEDSDRNHKDSDHDDEKQQDNTKNLG
jgi:hypothetical protein